MVLIGHMAAEQAMELGVESAVELIMALTIKVAVEFIRDDISQVRVHSTILRVIAQSIHERM